MNMSELERGWKEKIGSKTEVEINSPEIIFGVDASFAEHISSLEEVCNTNNLDKTKELLDKNKFVENIVIRKGKDKDWLRLLEKAVNSLTKAEVGKDITAIADALELERLIRSGDLPSFAVAELAGAFYHLNMDDESERLAGLLTAADVSVVGAVTQANAFNTLGCIYLRQGDVKGSFDAHNAGLKLLSEENLANDLNARWQMSKLKYGILIDTMELRMPDNILEQLFKLKRERGQLGDTFNIARVDLDAARACIALKKKDQAIGFALKAKDGMGMVGYWSGAAQTEQLYSSLIKKKKKS